MKIDTNKSAVPVRLVRLGNARQQTKASFTGKQVELLHPDLQYTIGG